MRGLIHPRGLLIGTLRSSTSCGCRLQLTSPRAHDHEVPTAINTVRQPVAAHNANGTRICARVAGADYSAYTSTACAHGNTLAARVRLNNELYRQARPKQSFSYLFNCMISHPGSLVKWFYGILRASARLNGSATISSVPRAANDAGRWTSGNVSRGPASTNLGLFTFNSGYSNLAGQAVNQGCVSK